MQRRRIWLRHGVAHRLVHDNLLLGMVFAHRLHPVRCIPVRPMRKLSHTRAKRLVDLIALPLCEQRNKIPAAAVVHGLVV